MNIKVRHLHHFREPITTGVVRFGSEIPGLFVQWHHAHDFADSLQVVLKELAQHTPYSGRVYSAKLHVERLLELLESTDQRKHTETSYSQNKYKPGERIPRGS
jgi:hypothetical protein